MNPNHDPKTGEFSSGPGGGGPMHKNGMLTGVHAIDQAIKGNSGQRDGLRSSLRQVQSEHAALAAKLMSGRISPAELSRLDEINQFVFRNQHAISTLK